MGTRIHAVSEFVVVANELNNGAGSAYRCDVSSVCSYDQFLLNAVILLMRQRLGRPVVDRTGLDGSYDFELKLIDPDAPNRETGPKGNLLRQLDGGLNASLRNLGLKLEAQKVPVEILVINQVEKPSEN